MSLASSASHPPGEPSQGRTADEDDNELEMEAKRRLHSPALQPDDLLSEEAHHASPPVEVAYHEEEEEDATNREDEEHEPEVIAEDAELSVEDKEEENADETEVRGRTLGRTSDNSGRRPSSHSRDLSPGQQKIRKETQMKFGEFERMKVKMRRMEERLEDTELLLDQERQGRQRDRKFANGRVAQQHSEFQRMQEYYQEKFTDFRDLSSGVEIRDYQGVAPGSQLSQSEKAARLLQEDVFHLNSQNKKLLSDNRRLEDEIQNVKDSLMEQIGPTMIEPLHEQLIDAQMEAEDWEKRYRLAKAEVSSLQRKARAFNLAKKQYQRQLNSAANDAREADEERKEALERVTELETFLQTQKLTGDHPSSDELRAVKSKLDASEEEIDHWRTEVAQGSEREAKLAKEVKKLQKVNEGVEARIRNLEYYWRDRVNNGLEKQKKLQKSLDLAREQIETMKVEHELAMNTRYLQRSTPTSSPQLSLSQTSTRRMSFSEREISRLQAALRQSEDEQRAARVSHEKAVSNMKSMIQKSNLDMRQLQTSSADQLEASAKRIKLLQDELQAAGDEVKKEQASRELEVQDLRKQLRAEQEGQRVLKDEHESNMRSLQAQLQTARDDRQKAEVTYVKEIASLERRVQSLKAELADEEKQNASLVAQSKESQQDQGLVLANLNEQIQQLRSDLKIEKRNGVDLEQKAQGDKKLHEAQISELNRQLHALQASTSQQEASSKRVQELLKHAEQRANQLEALVQERDESVKKLEQELKDIKSTHNQIDVTIQKNIHRLQEALAQNRGQVNRLTMELKRLHKDNAEIEARARRTTRDHEAAVSRLKAHIKSLKVELEISKISRPGHEAQTNSPSLQTQEKAFASLRHRVKAAEKELHQEKAYNAVLIKENDRLQQRISDVVAAAGSGPASLYDLLRSNLVSVEHELEASRDAEKQARRLLQQSIAAGPHGKQAMLDEFKRRLSQKDEALLSSRRAISSLAEQLRSTEERLGLAERQLSTLEPSHVGAFLQDKFQLSEAALAASQKEAADAQQKLRHLEETSGRLYADAAVAMDLDMEKRLSANLQKENDELRLTCVELTGKLNAQAQSGHSLDSKMLMSLASPSRAVDILSLMGGPLPTSPAVLTQGAINDAARDEPLRLPYLNVDPLPSDSGHVSIMEIGSPQSFILNPASSVLDPTQIAQKSSPGPHKLKRKPVPIAHRNTSVSLQSPTIKSEGLRTQVSSMLEDIVRLRKALADAKKGPCTQCERNQQKSWYLQAEIDAGAQTSVKALHCKDCKSHKDKISELIKGLRAEQNLNHHLREQIASGVLENDHEIKRLENVLRVMRVELVNQQNEYDQIFQQMQRVEAVATEAVDSNSRSGAPGSVKEESYQKTECENCSDLSQRVHNVRLAFDKTKGEFFIGDSTVDYRTPTVLRANSFATTMWAIFLISSRELRLELLYLSRSGALRLLVFLAALGVAYVQDSDTFTAMALICIVIIVSLLAYLAFLYPYGDLLHIPFAKGQGDSNDSVEDPHLVSDKNKPVAPRSAEDIPSTTMVVYQQAPSPRTEYSFEGGQVYPSEARSISAIEVEHVPHDDVPAFLLQQAYKLLQLKVSSLSEAFSTLCKAHIKAIHVAHQISQLSEDESTAVRSDSSAIVESSTTARRRMSKVLKDSLEAQVRHWRGFSPWKDHHPGEEDQQRSFSPDARYLRLRNYLQQLKTAYAITFKDHAVLMRCYEAVYKASKRSDKYWLRTLAEAKSFFDRSTHNWTDWRSSLVLVDGQFRIPVEDVIDLDLRDTTR